MVLWYLQIVNTMGSLFQNYFIKILLKHGFILFTISK